METLNKNGLVDAIHGGHRMTHDDAVAAFERMFITIQQTLLGGGEISIRGLGILRVVVRPAGEGRNPQTGERIKVPAKKRVVFKTGKALSDALNGDGR